jgi:hypothetical protein
VSRAEDCVVRWNRGKELGGGVDTGRRAVTLAVIPATNDERVVERQEKLLLIADSTRQAGAPASLLAFLSFGSQIGNGWADMCHGTDLPLAQKAG